MVDGVAYTWTIRPKPTRWQADYEDGCLDVAIAREDAPGRKLIVHTTIPHPQNSLVTQPSSVRPSQVRRWIESSVRQGWTVSSASVVHARSSESGVALARQYKPDPAKLA